eukprot:TRINITY_DN6154_c0_g1_i20.p1 TRINITY_DN6154_c0_g1~~TRINITY_DN6154_c0_g1_i20.p1  ORF type:complete len:252 (-),score=26.74 TRINITY_DN6154_c0_g1_i20:102-857(-)
MESKEKVFNSTAEQIINFMLKKSDCQKYDPGVESKLYEILVKYSSDILKDAQAFAKHADRNFVSEEDVKESIKFNNRDFNPRTNLKEIDDLAKNRNKMKLHTVAENPTIQVPHVEQCLLKRTKNLLGPIDVSMFLSFSIDCSLSLSLQDDKGLEIETQKKIKTEQQQMPRSLFWSHSLLSSLELLFIPRDSTLFWVLRKSFLSKFYLFPPLQKFKAMGTLPLSVLLFFYFFCIHKRVCSAHHPFKDSSSIA